GGGGDRSYPADPERWGRRTEAGFPVGGGRPGTRATRATGPGTAAAPQVTAFGAATRGRRHSGRAPPRLPSTPRGATAG
ncbi:hypothetical protein ACFV9E_17305, partial [Streptomyces sp. NPDC059835]